MRIVRITDRNMTKVTATKEYRKTSSLRNWDKNPRAIKKDRFEELKARITRRGQYKPLVVTDDGEVLGGNMRLRAFNDLDIEDVWVSVVHPESEADKIAIALEDNEELGYYEDQAVAELIAQYKDEIDLTKYQIHLSQPKTLEEILQQFSPDDIVEDEAPEVSDEEPESKLGEVYQLGRHRLMCGDSTKIEDVEKLMDGNKADMVFTDPPYGIADIWNGGSGHGWGKSKKEGVKRNEWDNWKPDKEYFDSLLQIGNHQVVWGGNYFDLPISRGWLVWNKPERNFTLAEAELAWTSKDMIIRVGDFNRSDPGRTHPTQKPLKLFVWALGFFDEKNVYDPFGGSGSTLIACEQTDRTCYMMELDPKYCDVIRKRYENLVTGK
jgi:16S rRNA G966 N2-methylase RsmD